MNTQPASQNKQKSFAVLFLLILFSTTIGFLLGKLFDAGYPGAGIGFAISFIYACVAYFFTETILLSVLGARSIIQENNDHLYNRINELSQEMRIPVPALYYIDDSAMNILSLGKTPQSGKIVITKGLMDKLTTSEVEAVIAHEMAHIKNADTRLAGLAAVVVAGFPLLAESLRRKSPLFFPISFVLSLFSPISGLFMQLLISTKREFEADAAGVLITRYPQGLIQALEKITHDPYSVKTALQATAHMFITNPFHGKANRSASLFFSTHPPIKDRIKILQEM